MRHISKAWILSLPTNIKIGWKRLALPNTLAYFKLKSITIVKCFMANVPGFLETVLGHARSVSVALLVIMAAIIILQI
jgi:hypothetical protein